ncbi:MAG: GIY-YIG nuclease family protein [Deltaproteobacteria bacterium]|nr:GIY-YIG nuclease family protein [Deltaproteobacteria bacterium]MBW2331367.1 GIY-YIG nuclease family protein [Deltaproteobacteria bacterium]
MDPWSTNGRPAFHYVYILQSESNRNRFYIGFTGNLRSRLEEHNSGKNPHTAKSRPWRIKTDNPAHSSKMISLPSSDSTLKEVKGPFAGPEIISPV